MKLYESLFILRRSAQAIDATWKLVNPMNGFEHDAATTVHLYNIILLEAVIFFEEFDGQKNNIEPEFHQRMKDVGKIIGPIRKKINLQHLQNFRNNFIAHPWRDRKGKFIFPDDPSFKVPRNLLEMNVLVLLIRYIDVLVRAEFEKESADATIFVYSQVPPPPPTRDYSTLNHEQLQMVDEVNEIAKNLNRNYQLKIVLFDFSNVEIPESKPKRKQ